MAFTPLVVPHGLRSSIPPLADGSLVSTTDSHELALGMGGVVYFLGAGGGVAPRVEVPFAFGDASPVLLATVPAGKVVERVDLVVLVPFDGAGASLQVGDAGDPGRLLAPDANDPALAATYSTSPGYAYGGSTPITLTITPGFAASQGRGLVIVTIQL